MPKTLDKVKIDKTIKGQSKVEQKVDKLYVKSDYFTIKLNRPTLPKGFVQKPVLRYRKIEDTVFKTPHMIWVETKSYDYYYLHMDEKEYKKFRTTVFAFFLTLLIIATLALMVVRNAYTDGQMIEWMVANVGIGYYSSKITLYCIGYIIIVLVVASAITYSWFRSTFFHSSLLMFLESDEYKRICSHYDSLDKIRNIKHRRILTLKRMLFLNPEVWKEYQIFHKEQNAIGRKAFFEKLRQLFTSSRFIR